MGHEEEKKEVLCLSGPTVIDLMQEVHEKGAAFRFKPAGHSMKPSICHNDIITLSPLRKLSPFPGEVVAIFLPEGSRFILHRVIKKEWEEGQILFSIKGDNHRQTDARVARENIMAVVTKVERQGKDIFWPNRFRHPFWAKLYFRGYLGYTKLRYALRVAYGFIVTYFSRKKHEDIEKKGK